MAQPTLEKSIMLSIDSNEPEDFRSAVIKEATKRKVQTEVKRLPVGDYCWDDEIIIERKSVPDYIGSLRDGRLFTQVLDMEQYSHAYLFLHGSFKGIEYVPHLNTFKVEHRLGSMCSILARTQVKILHVDNKTQFINAIFTIKEKSDKGPKTYAVERHKKTINRQNPSFGMFMSIPGVGEETAKKLSKEYPNFYELLHEVKMGFDPRIPLQTNAMEFLENIVK